MQTSLTIYMNICSYVHYIAVMFVCQHFFNKNPPFLKYIDKTLRQSYNNITKYFQGGAKFPTGSKRLSRLKVCEPRERLNR